MEVKPRTSGITCPYCDQKISIEEPDFDFWVFGCKCQRVFFYFDNQSITSQQFREDWKNGIKRLPTNYNGYLLEEFDLKQRKQMEAKWTIQNQKMKEQYS